MLQNGVRRCDLCNREIPKGQRFIAHLVEKTEIPQGVNLTLADTTIDERGDIRMDICWTCQTNIGLLSGEEAVD